MCGIVGAVAERNITAVLVEGLKRLEYRGYDSAGVALLNDQGVLQRSRRVGKVSELESALSQEPLARSPGRRPYPLGHPRRAERAQRAPAFLRSRSGRGAQRHHRESRRTARPAQRRWVMCSARTPTPK